MSVYLAYPAAALCEIGGCFAFWAWWRSGHSVLWLLPGLAALALFAWLLAQVPTATAGRAYAAYGGVYVVASLLWVWIVEGTIPDQWDIVGGAVVLAGASLILFGSRGV